MKERCFQETGFYSRLFMYFLVYFGKNVVVGTDLKR